ncbi:ferredoxin [bacterium BMS3Bbin03]|nr:ferredoxin [bacterium BMS3Bbin03]
MIIAIASGKCGAGKTTLAVSLALTVENSQYLDCAVEAPNGQIFLKPEIEKQIPVLLPYPRVNDANCDFCGECAGVCEYGAIAVREKQVLIFDDLCRSCGACLMLCPSKTMYEVKLETGVIEIGHSETAAFGAGILKSGSTRARPLIGELKKRLDPSKNVIIDAPPGTSSPAVEAVKDSDFCVLVTEPTRFGLNALRLAVEMTRETGVPAAIVINRSDGKDDLIVKYARVQNIPILLQIPQDRKIAEAYSRGISPPEFDESYRSVFKSLFRDIQTRVRK